MITIPFPAGGATLSDAAPAPLDLVAEPGTAVDASRHDHVHPSTGLALLSDPRLTDWRTPLDGSVTDAKVAAGAGIARSKLDFGAGLTDADVAAAAGIAKSKLGALSIGNADVASGAAIAYSKLALAGSILNADIAAGAGIPYLKLSLTGGIVNADIAAGAAIAKSKLAALAITDADIAAGAAIAKAKLAALGIVDADVAAGAAIAYAKLALTGNVVNADIAAAAAIAYSKLNLTGSLVNADVSATAAIAKSKLASLGIVDADVAAGAAIAKSKLAALGIVDADVAAGAAIAKSKLAALAIVNADVAAAAAIANTKLDPQLAWGKLGYAEVTANQLAIGVLTDLTGLSVTVTVGTGRRIKITGHGIIQRSVRDGVTVGYIREGATQLGRWLEATPPNIGTGFTLSEGSAVITPTAGAHTYKLSLETTTGTGTSDLLAAGSNAAFILVEDIGPA